MLHAQILLFLPFLPILLVTVKNIKKFERYNEKKVELIKTVNRVCVKRCQNIYFIGLKKKTCLGCFRIEEIRDNDKETGLKEGGGIEMSSIVLHSL